jgi:hypothetical protein
MTETSITDFSRYHPPGVYTNPQRGPQLSVNSTLPNAVALFGASVGYRSNVESVQIEADTQNGTVATPTRVLAHSGIVTDSSDADSALNPVPFMVKRISTGFVYQQGSDYEVVLDSGTQGSSQATYRIKRIIDGDIAPGEVVQVSYRYTDEEYFTPQTFYDYDDVRRWYGDPYNTSEYAVNGVAKGNILSELTLAAKFAFLNGAYEVVTVAVDFSSATTPVAAYENALELLQDRDNIAIVVPCGGGLEVAALVKTHIKQQSENRFERRAIIGVDGSNDTLRIHKEQRLQLAATLRSDGGGERVALVSPDRFAYYSPEVNREVTVGGQYMAASLAGMAVKLSYAQPLTHKAITGWTKVLTPPSYREGDKNDESKGGVMVVEKTRSQKIWVRHGVTVDNSELLYREWNITGQQDAMVYRLRDYLENANLIGQPIYDYTLVNVKAAAEGALQSLLRDGLMVNYTGLKARQLLTNPDVIEVGFSWLPAFPLNYIVVSFAVSLTTGNINSQGVTANGGNVGNLQAGNITAPATPIFNDFGGSSNTLNTTL